MGGCVDGADEELSPAASQVEHRRSRLDLQAFEQETGVALRERSIPEHSRIADLAEIAQSHHIIVSITFSRLQRFPITRTDSTT